MSVKQIKEVNLGTKHSKPMNYINNKTYRVNIFRVLMALVSLTHECGCHLHFNFQHNIRCCVSS